MTMRGPATPTKDEQTKKKDKDDHTKQKDNDRTRRRAEEVWAAKIPKSRFPADSGPNCRHRGMYDACWLVTLIYSSPVRPCLFAMSALGQKQTFAMQKGMSALLPKADIRSASANADDGSKTIAVSLIGDAREGLHCHACQLTRLRALSARRRLRRDVLRRCDTVSKRSVLTRGARYFVLLRCRRCKQFA